MTTRIHDRSGLPTYVGLTATGNTVTVRARNLMASTAEVDRAEFLAAVAAELDAVVIDREELPEIELKNGWIVSNGAYHEELDSVNGPDEIRREATEMLAIAEFLEANPPVDEAQVKAIADLLSAEVPVGNYQGLARRLYLAGVRVSGDDK